MIAHAVDGQHRAGLGRARMSDSLGDIAEAGPTAAQDGPRRRAPVRRCAVLSFSSPMLAPSGRPDGPLDGWVVEPKADGWRAQVAVDADGHNRRNETAVG